MNVCTDVCIRSESISNKFAQLCTTHTCSHNKVLCNEVCTDIIRCKNMNYNNYALSARIMSVIILVCHCLCT